MLLEELTSTDLDFLAKALSQMEAIGNWNKLEKDSHNLAALKEAIALYNWALHENGAQFSSEYRALTTLLAGRSATGAKVCLGTLLPTGFVKRNQLILDLNETAWTGPHGRFLAARQEAIPFIKATRLLFYRLKLLADIATPGTIPYENNDGLNRKIASAALKKLGITAERVSVEV